MTHKLIHTPHYLLVVDDSEIKEGDWFFEKAGRLGPICFNEGKVNLHMKKIIAHLPLNGSPILEGVDLLPPLEQEDDVEKLAQSFENKRGCTTDEYRDGVEDGYNKAKEKYKYTEEDVKIAIQQAFLSGVERLEDFEKVEKMTLENTQSLSQPKMPVEFECETVCEQGLFDDSVDSCYCNYGSYKIVPKTTTNSQGQTVWAGKYIY